MTRKPRAPVPPPAAATSRRVFAVGPLAEPLKRLMAERRTSARSLSIAAGLPSGTIRNILTGRSTHPKAEIAQALADALGVHVEVLHGRDPPPEAPSGSVEVREVEIRPTGAVPCRAADLTHDVRSTWTMPAEMAATLTATGEGVVLVAAPEDGEGFRRGDRLLLDSGDTTAAAAGTHLLWDGHGLGAATCLAERRPGGDILRIRRQGGWEREARLGEEVEVLGRIVGAWRKL